MACGILVPQPEIKPMPPPPVEAWSLNHWTTREFPKHFVCIIISSNLPITPCPPMQVMLAPSYK